MKQFSRKIFKYFKENKKRISPLLILTHDHPDPDAMASAYALRYLASRYFNVKSKIAYGGRIGRMENQTMAEELHVPVYPLKQNDFKKFASFALKIELQNFHLGQPQQEETPQAMSLWQ